MADEDPNENGDEQEKTFQERVEEIREKRAQESDEDREERLKDAMGGGGGPGAGGMGGQRESGGDEELVREVRQLRDEVRDATRQLQRIADALEE